MHWLLPHGHVLGVFLQPVKWRVWLHADAVVVVLGVASGGRVREKAETGEEEEEEEKSCRLLSLASLFPQDPALCRYLVPRRRVLRPMKTERMSLPKEAALTGSSFCS